MVECPRQDLEQRSCAFDGGGFASDQIDELTRFRLRTRARDRRIEKFASSFSH